MLHREIYKNVHTILSKDGNEGLITLDRWNVLIHSLLYKFIRNEAKLNNVILENGNEQMISLKILKKLITWQENISLSDPGGGYAGGSSLVLNSVVLDYEMMYWGEMWTHAVLNGIKRKIELVSYSDFISRFSNMMNMNIDENPVAYIVNELYSETTYYDYARIYPTGIGTIDFLYIRKPTTPFLDYYIDANWITQFMDIGTSRALTTGEQYRDGTTTGTKTSITKELEIPDDMHPAFQDYIIQEVSLMLGDQYTNQVKMAKQQLDEKS